MKNFTIMNLNLNKAAALIFLFSTMFLYSQSQSVTGDIVKTVDLGEAGWVSLVWDGTHLLSQNEAEGNWFYIDPNTGEKTAAFNNPTGGALNAQGASWSEARGTIFTLQYASNQGEVWELNPDGTVANSWDANIFNPNRQRGLVLVDDEVWIGQGNIDADPPNTMLFRFDYDGNALTPGVIMLNEAIVYSREMEWINGQLWVNDNGAAVLRVYDYDAENFTLTQVRMYPRTHWSQFGMAYTGTELLSTGWNSSTLYWYKAGDLVVPPEEIEIGDPLKSIVGHASTSIAWDGEFAWGLCEDDNLWHQIDKNNGPTGVTFANAPDALAWAQGAAWSTTNSTFFTNQFDIGDGEIWEIDKNGTKVNGWSAGLGNDIRGIAIQGDTIWVSVILSNTIYRFDLSGTRLADVSLDIPILWAGGMDWVDGKQLWVNDRDGQHIAIYDYDDEAETLTKVKIKLIPFFSFFGMTYTGEEMLTAGWGTDDWYWLKSGLYNGIIDNNMVSSTLLTENYPNPFNQSTTIHYTINKSDNVNITIYDMQGQKVVELINEFKVVGEQSVVWNGTDEKGSNVKTGIYFYKITSGNDSCDGKMVLIR